MRITRKKSTDLKTTTSTTFKTFRNSIFFAAIFFFGIQSLQAQQRSMFTQYMFNSLAVNPGYAGTKDALTATLMSRHQWVGLDGAPVTNTFTAHMPWKQSNIGVGLSLYSDRIGNLFTRNAAIDIAYRIHFKQERSLSIGIKAMGEFRSNDMFRLQSSDYNDPNFSQTISQFLPNAGIGFYYRTPKFYAGGSIMNLIRNSLDMAEGIVSTARQEVHGWYIMGGILPITTNILFKPTTLVKFVPNAPVEAEITATFIFNEKISVGAMYRTGDAYGALLGYYFTPQLMAGYSYDFSYATVGQTNMTHEFLITYDFIFNTKEKIKSPRFF